MAPKTLVWSPAEEDTRATSLELEWSGFMVCLNVFTTLLRSGREKDELNGVWDWPRSVGGFRLDTGMNDWKWTDLFIHSEPSKPVCEYVFMSHRIICLLDKIPCKLCRDAPPSGTLLGRLYRLSRNQRWKGKKKIETSNRRVSSPWPPDWQASVLSIELKPKAVKESLNHEHLVISQP